MQHQFSESILLTWTSRQDIPDELTDAFFIMRISTNNSTLAITKVPVALNSFDIANLQMNTSYDIEFAIGVEDSERLWDLLQPIHRMTVSTLPRSKSIYNNFFF